MFWIWSSILSFSTSSSSLQNRSYQVTAVTSPTRLLPPPPFPFPPPWLILLAPPLHLPYLLVITRNSLPPDTATGGEEGERKAEKEVEKRREKEEERCEWLKKKKISPFLPVMAEVGLLPWEVVDMSTFIANRLGVKWETWGEISQKGGDDRD